jgi:hypothetical protein
MGNSVSKHNRESCRSKRIGEARVLVGRTGTIGSGKQLEQHREKRWVKLVLR